MPLPAIITLGIMGFIAHYAFVYFSKEIVTQNRNFLCAFLFGHWFIVRWLLLLPPITELFLVFFLLYTVVNFLIASFKSYLQESH